MRELLTKFPDARILVLGDVMLDKYVHGKVERISPEAPVPVVEVTEESFAPGGAANVASNAASLGGKVALFGLMGNDNPGKRLLEILEKSGVTIRPFFENNRPTTQKIRVVSGNQLLRMDYEERGDITKKTEDAVLSKIKPNQYDVIVISDYMKGFVTSRLCEKLKALVAGTGTKLLVDPKPAHKDYYKNVYALTPNQKEAFQLAGLNDPLDDDVEAIGTQLAKELNTNVLITRGPQGISLFEKGAKTAKRVPTKRLRVFDVTGAGDTTVAALAISIAVGASLKEAATIANTAAGLAVSQRGTTAVKLRDLKEQFQ